MRRLKTAIIVGSNRRESINRKLAIALTRLEVAALDFSFVAIDDLPIYNQDHEGNRPVNVNRFTDEIAASEAVLIVTPEHNRSLPALLKNAIDWGSKPAEKNVWRGKPMATTGTSPGALGTASVQLHLRQILGILGAIFAGGEAYITHKPELFDANGDIAIEGTRKFLKTYLEQFATLATKLTAG